MSAQENENMNEQEGEKEVQEPGFDNNMLPDFNQLSGDDNPAGENEPNGDDDPTKGDEEEPGSEEEVNGIAPELVYRAAQVGLGLEEVKQFKDAESLSAALSLLEERMQAQAKDGEETGEKEPEWFELDLGEEYDDELRDKFKQYNNFMRDQFIAVREQVQDMRELVENQANALFEQRFEGAVNRLGDEWKDVFGQGEIVDVNDKQRENRIKLIDAVDRLMSADVQVGRQRSIDAVIKDALAVTFGDKLKSMERERIKKKAGKRTKISKPQTSAVSGESGEDEAIQFIREGLIERGATPVASSSFMPF